jgi:hypothetical protein
MIADNIVSLENEWGDRNSNSQHRPSKLGVEFSFSSFLFHKTVAIVVDVAADDICSTTNKQTKKNNNNIHLLFILWRCE